MDVNKLEFVGKARNEHMKWKITVPADDDVEIWSQYDEKSGQLHIQEKRLFYPMKMTITYFMLEVCKCFDEDLIINLPNQISTIILITYLNYYVIK
jgi:hypothetical protein